MTAGSGGGKAPSSRVATDDKCNLEAAILVDEERPQDECARGIGALNPQRSSRVLEAAYESPIALGKVRQIPPQIDQPSRNPVAVCSSL
jgi:hypothetical protein